MRKSDQPELGAESTVLAELEAQLVATASASVQTMEDFHELLTETGGRSIFGWEFDPRKNKLSRAAGEQMLRDTLAEVVQGLRKKLFPLLMRNLDVYRAGVIAHLGLIAGCDRLNENVPFWQALVKCDYDAAFMALMETQWPPLGDSILRKRVPQLALALVRGKTI